MSTHRQAACVVCSTGRNSRIREVVAIVLALLIIALLLQTGHGQAAAAAEGII